MECKLCSKSLLVRNGIVRGKQRYKCKNCGYNFVQGALRRGKNLDKQKLALHMYLENMGFRDIGRVLGVSNVTVLNWVKSAGSFIREYHNENKDSSKVQVMEFDEMWHFISSKKQKFGFGLLWTDQNSVLLSLSQEVEQPKQVKNYGNK